MVWPSRLSLRMNCHRAWRSSTSTPAVGAGEARENADQRGLAGSVGPEQPEELSLRDLEVDPRERLQSAEALVDFAELDRRRHAGVARAENQLDADWSSSETP